MHYLQSDLTESAMEQMNMNGAELYCWAAMTVVLLLLVLLFLMMGISAFTEADSFSAVVNSLLAGLAGVAAMASSARTASVSQVPQGAGGAVNKALAFMSTYE